MKQFRNIASDINVKHKKSSHRFFTLSQIQNIFSSCQALGLWDIKRLGLQPNGVHSPLSERKRNATQDRWMTDESFPFMRLRMLTWICCHVSVIEMCLRVWGCVWERQKSKRKKRGCEGVGMRFYFPLLHYASAALKFSIQGPHPVPIYLTSITFLSPCLQHSRCFTWREQGLGNPLPDVWLPL